MRHPLTFFREIWRFDLDFVWRFSQVFEYAFRVLAT